MDLLRRCPKWAPCLFKLPACCPTPKANKGNFLSRVKIFGVFFLIFSSVLEASKTVAEASQRVIASAANVRNNPGDSTAQSLLANAGDVVAKRAAGMHNTIQSATADQVNGITIFRFFFLTPISAHCLGQGLPRNFGFVAIVRLGLRVTCI